MITSAKPQKAQLVAHPFLFGLFPILSLFSANSGWVALREVLLPAAAILTIASVLWLVMWPILPPRKRGLVITLFWIPFFGYGAALDFLRAQFDFREMISPAQAIAIGVVLLVVASGLLYALRRAPWTLIPLNRFLNHASALVIAVALVSCMIAAARRQAPQAPGDAQHEAAPAPAPAPEIPVALGPEQLAALPNIYFIICDAYPRSDHLKAYFGYDDTPFLNQLRERGFYVAEKSRSNYCNTLPSLASTLNLDFLDPQVFDPENFRKNQRQLLALIRDNVVVRTLKAHGYEYVAIPSGMFPAMMSGADRFIHPGTFTRPEERGELLPNARPARPGAFDITEYQKALIDMTPVRSIMNRVVQLWWYQLVPFALEELSSLRREGRPMFVFTHLLAPHVPHAYDAHGNFVEKFPPFREGWRTVTQYLNTRLIEVVDAIQASEPNSIIIIQGDHGSNASMPDARNKLVEPWEGEWPDYVRDRSANLSACYLPGKNYEGLFYPELTPVNLFRIIFDTYLETDYGKLEDATFLSPQNSHEVVRITEVY